MSIPSPYNFVPLSDKIYFPDWSEQVTHDIPFSNAISGELEIQVTSKTPIYIRNGGTFPEETIERNNSPEYQEFFRLTPDGNYAIPGTSFKGMLRRIIEILSYSKMSLVDDKRYSVRDLTNKNRELYTSHMTETVGNKVFRSRAKAAWLHWDKTDDTWYLIPCEYARVEQTDLERYYAVQRKNAISIGTTKQNARDKYNDWNISLDIQCKVDATPTNYRHTCGELQYRKVQSLGSGTTQGTIVFTGQPGPRSNRSAKHMEFVFFNSHPTQRISIDSTLRKEFEFIHSNDRGEPNTEWDYWKPMLETGVPVFYLEKKSKLASFGLAMMYRLPYENSIHETIVHTNPDHISSTKHDMAELLFGYITKGNALKGRVQVGHLVAQGNIRPLPNRRTVLGSPKPTYYPNYIEQEHDAQGKLKGASYKTFMDKDARIRGWKDYPRRGDNFTPNPPRATTQSVETAFTPLPAETLFKGKIRFHNLKPEELGALVWAITWGGNSNLCHGIGMAKPYGYGSIHVAILEEPNFTSIDGTNYTIQKLCTEFENTMQRAILNWKNSAQIVSLRNMANPGYNPPCQLEYPELERRDFVNLKKESKVLLSYAPLTSVASSQGRKYKNGDKVQCIVLEEKTKKGAHKFQIKDADPKYTGCLSPGEEKKSPKDLSPGQVYEMILASESPNNCQFRWC